MATVDLHHHHTPRYDMPPRPIEVVCGLIEHEGRLLACLRPPGKHLGGLWEFPGGKVEPDESKESALIRELHEELHIQVSVLNALTPVDWADEHVRIRLYPFLCCLESGTPHPAEHSEIRWCSPADLPLLTWAEADIPIFREWLDYNENSRPCPPHC
jgi:8-oxo-dGTP diphosphatase